MTRGEAALLERLAVDLDGGYADFVRAHADAVYATAVRLTTSRADAEDIAQETFVRAYRSLRRFDAERVRSLRARPWLLSITLNLWRNVRRRANRHPESAHADPGAELPDTSPGPEAAAERSDEARYLTEMLAALPDHQRIPVVLRHIAGLSHDDIATALECPVGTAKANVSRGVARLRALARGSMPPGARPGRPPRPQPAEQRSRQHVSTTGEAR